LIIRGPYASARAALLAQPRRKVGILVWIGYLDLYLSGEFPKEILTERKARLEATIRALEKERAGLMTHLEARMLTVDRIESLQDFTAKIVRGFEAAEEDFETRHRVIQLLDAQATLAVENGQKVVYARCILGEAERCVVSNSTPAANRQASDQKLTGGL
jgi:hypothetical protein